MVQMYKKIVNTQSVIWYGKTNKQFISLFSCEGDGDKSFLFGFRHIIVHIYYNTLNSAPLCAIFFEEFPLAKFFPSPFLPLDSLQFSNHSLQFSNHSLQFSNWTRVKGRGSRHCSYKVGPQILRLLNRE